MGMVNQKKDQATATMQGPISLMPVGKNVVVFSMIKMGKYQGDEIFSQYQWVNILASTGSFKIKMLIF